MERIDHISKVRKGTEQCNTEAWCEKCGESMTAGGVQICFDAFQESLYICSACMSVGKIS